MSALWYTGTATESIFPTLQNDIEADVVIVGGGITGLVTALQLSEAGQRVVLLEGYRIGQSNTGNSTGNLYATVAGGLDAISSKWDDDTVRQVVQCRSDAVDFVEQLTKRFNIDCQFNRCPLYLCLTRPDAEREQNLQQEYQVALAAGLSASIVNDIPELPFNWCKALRIENQAQFNPLRFCQGLAQALVRKGVLLFENSRVITADADTNKVTTADGSVTAPFIVHATHTPKGFNLLQAQMQVYREHCVSTTLTSGIYPEGIYWLPQHGKSIRSYHYNNEHHLAVVGEKHKTGHAEPDYDYIDKLQRYTQKHFSATTIDHSWSAQQFVPADLLPYIGKSGNDNVLVATGFAADGLTWGVVAGKILSDVILQRDNTYFALFDARRFTPVKSAKGWLAENAHVAKHLIKDHLTSPVTDSVEDVLPGEGRLVDIEGEKVAVYRSEDNQVCMLSPICPHLKCQVNWNSADRSWDCPCHGSRFNTDGSIIEGPALEPLKVKLPTGA